MYVRVVFVVTRLYEYMYVDSSDSSLHTYMSQISLVIRKDFAKIVPSEVLRGGLEVLQESKRERERERERERDRICDF